MSKRLIALCSLFVFVFVGIIGRFAYISFAKTYQVDESYNSYTLNIGTLNTNIYDRLGRKINNNSKQYVAVIRPNEKALSELDKLFDDNEIREITTELSKGYPVIRNVDRKVKTQHIQIFEKIDSDCDVAYHLMSKQTGGLESHVSEEIGNLSVNFTVDAMGRLLAGDEGSVINNNYDSTDGIIISIDRDIQLIAEEAANSINKGAVVVLDAESSRILASVSKGDDYLNRAISPYAVGSVFKLVVCACAIENGVNPFYNCTSSIKVNDTTFNCQNNHSHGIQDMKKALANSCNCYFVNLALMLGGEKLLRTAREFGFGNEFSLYKNWNISAGFFPTLETLKSKGQLALVGFGQGQLTDSPLHFASVVACIANGGNYYYPTLEINNTEENRVISEKTSNVIKSYMKYVVTNGTGSSANYNYDTAGKTATAQSGKYSNGSEILNTWFAGFYPYDNPQFAIVVMCENGTSGSQDCGPVFRTIVENIDKM